MLSVEQVAKIWSVSGRRVRALCANGEIPGAQKVGRSYLIPDDAVNPKEIKAKQVGSGLDKVLIVTKDKESFVARAVAHNFLTNEKEVYCNVAIKPLSKIHHIKKVTAKAFCDLNFVSIIFVNCFDEDFYDETASVVYVGKKVLKDNRFLKIVGFDLVDEQTLSYHGKIFYAEEGILKEIYSLLELKLEGRVCLPATIDLGGCETSPQLIKRFASIQKAYEFLREQYYSFDETDEFTHIAIGNEVEFSDSNQELDYFKSILLSLKKGVHANFIYVYDKSKLAQICNHFTTRMYAENLNENSGIYFISFDQLKKDKPEFCDYIDEGVIYYANKSVYHDEITEYTLGYINAGTEDLERCKQVNDYLRANSIKVANLKELEVFYELHK